MIMVPCDQCSTVPCQLHATRVTVTTTPGPIPVPMPYTYTPWPVSKCLMCRDTRVHLGVICGCVLAELDDLKRRLEALEQSKK